MIFNKSYFLQYPNMNSYKYYKYYCISTFFQSYELKSTFNISNKKLTILFTHI